MVMIAATILFVVQLTDIPEITVPAAGRIIVVSKARVR